MRSKNSANKVLLYHYSKRKPTYVLPKRGSPVTVTNSVTVTNLGAYVNPFNDKVPYGVVKATEAWVAKIL